VTCYGWFLNLKALANVKAIGMAPVSDRVLDAGGLG
jgi:hypothetical protein